VIASATRGLVSDCGGADDRFSREAVVQSEHQKIDLCLGIALENP